MLLQCGGFGGDFGGGLIGECVIVESNECCVRRNPSLTSNSLTLL